MGAALSSPSPEPPTGAAASSETETPAAPSSALSALAYNGSKAMPIAQDTTRTTPIAAFPMAAIFTDILSTPLASILVCYSTH